MWFGLVYMQCEYCQGSVYGAWRFAKGMVQCGVVRCWYSVVRCGVVQLRLLSSLTTNSYYRKPCRYAVVQLGSLWFAKVCLREVYMQLRMRNRCSTVLLRYGTVAVRCANISLTPIVHHICGLCVSKSLQGYCHTCCDSTHMMSYLAYILNAQCLPKAKDGWVGGGERMDYYW